MALKFKFKSREEIPAEQSASYVDEGSLQMATEELKHVAAEKERLELLVQGHKPEELDWLVGERIKGLKADWDKQLSTVTGEKDALTSRLTAMQIAERVKKGQGGA